MKIQTAPILFLLLSLCSVKNSVAQQPHVYLVHKLEKPIGKEEVSYLPSNPESYQLVINSNDRGSVTKLTAGFSSSDAQVRYTSIGQTSRFKTENIDTTILNKGDFPFSSNGSIKMRESLVAFWMRSGKPAAIPSAFGKAPVRIKLMDTLQDPLTHKTLQVLKLDDGLEEILWLDVDGKAIFYTFCDSEGDKREVIDIRYTSFFNFLNQKSTSYLIESYENNQENFGKNYDHIAITGGKIIDLNDGGKILDHQLLLLKNGKIAYIGKLDRALIPAGALVINAEGQFLIPGLWNMHVHLFHPEYLKKELLSGATTVRDMGNEFDFIRSLKVAAIKPGFPGPQILNAGLIDGKSPNALGIEITGNETDIKESIKKYHDAGFNQIKVYTYVKKNDLAIIVKAAQHYNMQVVGHLPFGYTMDYFLKNGINSLSHIHYFMNALKLKNKDLKTENQALLDTLMARKIYLDPTLNVYSLTGSQKISFYKRFLKLFSDYGIPIVAGTDNEGTIALEIQNYVAAGMTPLEAIRSATVVPARVMGLASQTGSLEAGKNADLLILKRNPLLDIKALDDLNYVIKGQYVLNKNQTP